MTEVISNVIRDIEKLLQIFKKERVGRIMKKIWKSLYLQCASKADTISFLGRNMRQGAL